MLRMFRKFSKNEKGATMIEYGLIAALVSVAAITALTTMGGSLQSMFEQVSSSLESAVPSGTGTGTGGAT